MKKYQNFFLILQTIIFQTKRTFENFSLSICLILEYFLISLLSDLNKFTSWLQIFPLIILLNILLMNSVQKFIDFYSLSKKKNNLINFSLSNFCFFSIFILHLMKIIGIFVMTFSFMKFIEEQNSNKKSNLNFLIL